MTEPTKEQVDKWRSEFENCFRFALQMPMQWQGYLAAKKSSHSKMMELEELQRETDEINKESIQWRDEAIANLNQEIKTLKEQLAKIEGILKFYADNESWDDDNIAFEDTEKRITEYDGKLLIFYEGGKLARQYFAEKEKQDKENKE